MDDRASILDALKRRHCYGATANIGVDVRCGDHLLGDALGRGPQAFDQLLGDEVRRGLVHLAHGDVQGLALVAVEELGVTVSWEMRR